MNFLGMGPGELMVIMVLALIVFGPQKLPEIGQGLGKAIGEFRRATTQITDEINRELSLDTPAKPQTPPAAPAPEFSKPVETSVSGQTQNDPLVLEIKPPTESTTVEAAAVDEAPATEEVIPESPAAYVPTEEVPTETLAVASDPAAPPAEALEGIVAEPALKKARTRRRKSTPASEAVEPAELTES